jgi:alpha-glucosidase
MDVKEQGAKHLMHQGLGNLISKEATSDGVNGQTDHGYFKASVFSPYIIRIQISTDEYFDELSYAVAVTPELTDFELDDNDAIISIETEYLRLEITRKQTGFRFFNSQRQLLNEDCPGLGVSFLGNTKAVYKTLQQGERFIGLGEKTGNLDRSGSGYTNLNTDSFAYSSESDPLYSTIPFYIGLHNNLAYGIFLDNTYQSHFNFGASNDRFSSFSVEGGDLNYYFITGASVSDIISSYTTLTGRMPLPPLWGLGYQQCRYSYYPDDEVYGLARTFREKRIPADAIVLDIHYMDRYKIFSWDSDRFPDPDKLIKDINAQGFNVVVMCDPGIKIEDNYQAYQDGTEKNLFLKYPDGTNYSGQVWPGWCHFPDFTNPKTRKWWGDMLKGYVKQGVKGYWNDMNEIATWGQKLPELIEFDFEGEGGSAKRGRNIYGLMMSRSTFEGVKKYLVDERPFNLTRSAYSGIQRYAAVWTGDNVSNDDHMLLGVRLVNSLGVSGIAYSGYDVGGFVGDASSALFARWISIGAFSPFFRGHTMINSKDSEPWAYGEEVEDISRNYINLRYQLLPYLYSVFHQASVSGIPVSRTLAIDYSFDETVYKLEYQNQYLFGPNILVAPVESYKELSKVYLPEGDWYNFHTEALHHGPLELLVEAPLTHLPIFVKAGSLIPMQSVVQSTQESPEPVLRLHVYSGGNSEFWYYEDDGSSYQHLEGSYYHRNMILDSKKNQLLLAAVEGSWISKFQQVKCYLHGFQEVEKVIINGEAQQLEEESLVFLPAVSSFDPLGKESLEYEVMVKTFTVDNNREGLKMVFR